MTAGVAAFVATCGQTAAGAEIFRVQGAERADGLSVVVERSGGNTASLRVVVLAGSRHDPDGQNGLVQVVSQAVLTGTTGDDPGALFRRMKRIGARLGARVTLDATIFAVDAPSSSFDEAGKLLLLALASPILGKARIDATRQLIDQAPFTPGSWAGDGWARAIDAMVYGGVRLDGSVSSRKAIAAGTPADFYRAHYMPGRMAIVATGDVTLASVGRMLDQAFMLPAREPSEEVKPRPEPVLPAELTERAPDRQVVFGYRACAPAAVDAPVCHVLGELVRQDLGARLHKDLGGGITVRGGFFELEADGFVAVQLTAGRWKGVREKAIEVFSSGPKRARSGDVTRAISGLQAEADWMRAHPELLADRYARHAIAGRKSAAAFAKLQEEITRVSATALAQAARTYFVPERQLSLRLTP